MKVEMISHTPMGEENCGLAAAVCTASDNPGSALRHAMESGHTSVLEHASFTFRIEGLSRAALAQLTRHRLASFSVRSQRFVKLEEPEVVIPDSIKASGFREEAECLIREAMNLYSEMVGVGIPKEDARYITPQAVATELVMTMNARELMHFFGLRTCNRAQWEIRRMADEMLSICKEVEPVLFGDAGPGCVTGRCTEKKPCGHPRSKDDWRTE